MPDSRVTTMPIITGANVADDDWIEIIDVSDPSLAPSGTNKRIRRPELNIALTRMVNVMDYGARGDYDPSVSTATAPNPANLAANNTAFAAAWAVAKAQFRHLYIPPGNYGIGSAILETFTDDAGIRGEDEGSVFLYHIDPAGTGTCVKQSITDSAFWAFLSRTAVPSITGITIDGQFAGAGSVGLRVGPAHSGYWQVRVRNYSGTGGVNGVTGMTGGIGILFQNESAFPNYFTESSVLGPRTSVQNCTNGIVFDRNGGHVSFGYNTFEFLHFRNCSARGISIMNGAYLYAGKYNIEGVTTLAHTTAAVTLDGGNSRFSGWLKFNYEINHVSAVVTLINIPDVTSLWRSEGYMDVLTSCFVLPTNNIPNPGTFHHEGQLAISPIPVGVVSWHCHSVFDPSTKLVTRVSGASNTASVFTCFGDFRNLFQKGTRVFWTESSVVKYGTCSTDSTFSAGTSLTTVTLAPNTDYWMAASPDVGSLRYSFENPPDYPGWFNFTPTMTGYSALPSVSASMPYTGVVTTSATDLFTRNAHGLVNGDTVTLSNISGSTGLATTILYYVITSTANTFQLSLTPGGAVVDITGANGTVTVNAAGPPSQLGYKFRIDGTMLTYIIRDGLDGNSNATTIAISLPIAASAQSYTAIAPMRVMDNGTLQTNPGSGSIAASATNCNVGKTYDAVGNFTATGKKRVSGGEIRYQI
jgi:hypothetical protein